MELKDKDVNQRGITVNSPSSDYEPTLGGLAPCSGYIIGQLEQGLKVIVNCEDESAVPDF